MKKIGFVLLAVLILSMFILTSCNMSLGFGNFNYPKVHICVGGINSCFTLTKWYDNDSGGIEVVTKEFGNLYLSEGTYILVKDKCPICDKAGK